MEHVPVAPTDHAPARRRRRRPNSNPDFDQPFKAALGMVVGGRRGRWEISTQAAVGVQGQRLAPCAQETTHTPSSCTPRVAWASPIRRRNLRCSRAER
eukprot:CAMPEP_0119533078 /NCGR_PEP_ID=MMETSP1344-20130328/46517_1 /TAXON_ID=236787 /ORGANISM="Florenciella parvula, Strain CCMP2471" /LENGTH=97 /DNA_ID=CAMNT_0007573827 /DNA_START=87 /DNA_END=376 /DNA_ORIENTATION=-